LTSGPPRADSGLQPDRYFERARDDLAPAAGRDPVCLYLETTNRCNLLCTTCPRTFEDLEPAADMSWEMFRQIVDQFPDIPRVVLHGVGEPMLVKELPRMIRHLKARGSYVLFNTNGTLLTLKKGRELIETGLDELRVSLDAADAATFAQVRGRDYFHRIVRHVRAFTGLQRDLGVATPRVSLWLTGLKETVDQLPAFVQLAADIGVGAVYLQRLVFFADAQGLASPDSALFENLTGEEAIRLKEAEELARQLGIAFDASGASEPETSLTRRSGDRPWSLCRRPWTVMYFTAHGRALPCCIAPFSLRGYDHFTLGDATRESLRAIWNGERYQAFRRALVSDAPPPSCANCGLRWSL
jgi:MoaA/NifB/PqqE/SkfB family radical SAM enzyme